MAEEKKTIMSVSVESRVFDVPESFRERAYIKSMDEYKKMWERSIKDPEGFWGEMASEFFWYHKWSKVKDVDFNANPYPIVQWFIGGKTNITVNCLDRHIQSGGGDKVAFYWVGNEPGEAKTYTYKDLYVEVNKFANVLKELGVKKGDRVSIYLPMIPELPIAMLACARIGAIHSVVFGGFSADSLADRILDAGSKVLITADGNYRGKKDVPLKLNADKAIEMAASKGNPVNSVVVVKRAGFDVPFVAGRDFWYHELMSKAADYCAPVVMDAEEPLFILYTSGSTGKPKGVLHTIGGYMVYVAQSFKYIFDYHPEDIFWCTADIGWVTGHSYIVYGPLAMHATEILFEGIPNYPEPDRFWVEVEKYKVNILYTAPTAIRALMREGDEWVKKHDLSSLRLLGTVGEPINPEAWIWYHTVVGGSRCPIVDTWWQTETGGILITPLPGAVALKPGSATVPFFGVQPQVVRENGTPCEVNEGGYLIIKDAWPGMMRTVFGQPERFKDTYFVQFPGFYFTGDGARQDQDGYYWLMGRVDDVINVAGHRLGTAEIESALVAHPAVAEAAVVGYPHEVKGQGIYAYVILKAGVQKSEELKKQLIAHVRKEIGPIATPDKIHFTDGLPKTRSGKIMRRILKKIAAGEVSDLGDTTTLADPSIVDELIKGRQ